MNQLQLCIVQIWELKLKLETRSIVSYRDVVSDEELRDTSQTGISGKP